MKLTKEQILGIIRHSLTFIGGIFVMKGLVDESTIGGFFILLKLHFCSIHQNLLTS